MFFDAFGDWKARRVTFLCYPILITYINDDAWP